MRLFHHPSPEFCFFFVQFFSVWIMKSLRAAFPTPLHLNFAGALMGINLPILLKNELIGKSDKRPVAASSPQGYNTLWARIYMSTLSIYTQSLSILHSRAAINTDKEQGLFGGRSSQFLLHKNNNRDRKMRTNYAYIVMEEGNRLTHPLHIHCGLQGVEGLISHSHHVMKQTELGLP